MIVKTFPDHSRLQSREQRIPFHFPRNRQAKQLLSGHDQAVLFTHYRELVRPMQAEQFWNIRPEGDSAKVVAFSESAK